MNTKLLRQKVLDLAIHGKLLDKAVVEALETTPGYEPASKLLERIRGESLPLATAGNPSSVAPSAGSNAARNARSKLIINKITETEIPFRIPNTWCWCRLGEIAYSTTGSTPSKECFKTQGIPYLKMYNIRNQKIDFDYQPQFISEEIHNTKLARSRTEVDDLLMNIVGPPLGKMALVPDWLPQCNFNQAAVLIRPFIEKKTINKYLFYYLSEMSEINSTVGRGNAGQVNISLTQTLNFRIPLPPLEEQKLIVEEIERIFALIDTVEQNKTDLETVIKQTKSKILDLAIHGKLVPQDKADEPASVLFEKIKKEKQLTDVDEIEELPFEIPSSWKWVHLSDVCLKLKRGKSPKYVEKSSYMAFAQKCNQKDGPTSLEKALYIDESSLNRYPPEEYMKKYDTVINSTGTGTLGRVGIYDCDVPEGIKGVFADSHVTTIHPSSYVNPKYVYYFVKSKQRYLEFAGEGSTNQKELKVTTIGEMEFPLPPLEEQNRIVSKIDIILKKLLLIQ